MLLFENLDKEVVELISKMNKNEKDRLEAIIAMNTMVINMNDEDAYCTWIYLVPDCATIWDLIDFALNDEPGNNGNNLFDEAVILFKKLWARYASEDKGLYIGDRVY